jgi:predicted extracellular nuclease
MKKVKIGTFNVENLFNRYKLLGYERGGPPAARKKPVDPEKFVKEGGHINMLGWSIDDFGPISKSARRATSAAILENKPDILAIQEVENLFALLAFNGKWLKNAYTYGMVIDGNDIRQIDVGILSKYPIISLRTHRFEPDGSPPWQRTFSRDCLEVDLNIGGKTLTVLVNHFKSKIGGGEDKREKQAKRVAEILKERFGNSLSGNFVVAGDLNNHYDAPELQPLLGLPGLENVVKQRLPEKEHWTHYYNKGKAAEQLDYLLISPELSEKNADSKEVHIERRGLPTDIKYYEGERFEEVKGKEGASDHCAVFISLEVA